MFEALPDDVGPVLCRRHKRHCRRYKSCFQSDRGYGTGKVVEIETARLKRTFDCRDRGNNLAVMIACEARDQLADARDNFGVASQRGLKVDIHSHPCGAG